MTDINTRGKLPFTVVSSSVNTGYAANLTASVGQNIDVVNYHKDEYGQLEGVPLQGPFSNQHVGGNQHRHIKLNDGSDNIDNRPEAFILSASANSIKVYGPDINGVDKPRAILTRGNTAKSPINISNIQTSGNIAGNFEHNYQIVQSVGRRTTNNLINDGFVASGNLTTQFVTGTQTYSLPEITNNSKSIFVERFNAPGGKQESSRGTLDREGEEYAPNNSLTTRNIKVRQPYYNQLSKHNKKFNFDNQVAIPQETNLESLIFSGSFNTGIFETFGEGFYLTEDGKYLYVAGSSAGSKVNWYELTVPYQIRYANWIAFKDLRPYPPSIPYGVTNTPRGITFTSDGKIMFIVSIDGIYKYNLSSAWNVLTAAYNSSLSLLPERPLAVSFDSTGTRLFIASQVGTSRIIEYTLSAPWDITSVTLKNTLEVHSLESSILGFYFDYSGLNLIICGSGSRKLIKYSLQKDRDLTSAKYSGEISIKEDSFIADIQINSNKDSLYIIGQQNDRIFQYNLDNYIFGEHRVNKNSIEKIEEYYGNYITSSRNDNFWVQHAIPATDLRYKWIADSVSSSQEPLEYQSYGEEYSRGGAFTDLQLEQNGPFGDHFGISGAIDKDEMFVSTYTNTMYRDRKYLYFTGSNDFYVDASSIANEISEKDFSISFWMSLPNSASNGTKDILVYSGSYSNNKLMAYVTSSIVNLFVSGTESITNYQLSSSLLDSAWHLVTLTSDVSSQRRRIRTFNGSTINTISYTTSTKIYLDGGVVNETSQRGSKLDISKIELSIGRNTEIEGAKLDEITVWNKVLSENQINELFRTTKTKYGQQPKKLSEHNLDNSSIPRPLHVYSSRVDKYYTLFDEIGSKDLILVNYTSSINIRPQNSGTISYSTYFNGPYQGANWKTIRNNEHPVTRKLTTENTNIISVIVPEGPRAITRTVRGIPIRINVPGGRKQGTILNVKEPPVYINNKPLKHKFILKDSTNPNSAFELTHTYGNNINYFANNSLNDYLGLKNFKEPQIYDKLLNYYNGNTENNDNPIEKLVGYTYSETIFPQPDKAGLKETRMRTDYITDQPGYGIDGYDRQLGTQRTFWRDSQDDRMRTKRNYITSLGVQVKTNYNILPFLTPSVAALEVITGTQVIGIGEGEEFSSFMIQDVGYKNAGELNAKFSTWRTNYNDPSGGSNLSLSKYYSFFIPAHNNPEFYFFKNNSTVRTDNNAVIYNDQTSLGGWDIKDPSMLRAKPSYCYEQISFVSCSILEANQKNYYTCSIDLGLNRYTEIISGKNPWYNNYEDYYEDVKNLSNDNLLVYSKIPEFKISEHINNLILKYSGDSKKIRLNEYKDNIKFNLRDKLEEENKAITKQDIIKLNIKCIKKLLPYNGFYPQDRSLQLVNYFSSSYLATGAVKGGVQIYDSYEPSSSSLNYSGSLEDYCKQSSLLEPFYAPGIFYNMIKSGIAVSWSVFTGSIPIPDIGEELYVPVAITPSYKIPFESIIDIFNGIKISSSNTPQENLIFKTKYYNNPTLAEDYGYSNLHPCYFNGFFELENKSNPLYTLSINNFLAETINFFLKDSKLNSFYSAPENEFSTLESNKTYYMDIVLKNNNIKMIDAHSSSLRYKYGKMKGMYFGPGFYSGSKEELNQLDPSYCIYTPPYFYGESIARLSFTPPTTRKYTLDEIFSEVSIEYFNDGLLNSNLYVSGNFYNSLAMNVADSVKLFGLKQIANLSVASDQIPNQTNNISRQQGLYGRGFTAANDSTTKQWVIYPKMETPILDFSSQEYITASILNEIDLTSYYAPHQNVTSSGFGIGMWSGYGDIPTGEQGIYIQLKESFPDKGNKIFETSTTGSLIKVCGFDIKEKTKKLGEIADSREISEAIVIIPYSDKVRRTSNIRLGYSNLSVNDTVKIEGKNLFKINKQVFDYQNNRINNNASAPAVNLQDFTQINGSIQETSISRMIKLMNKYVLPPNFDFLINPDIQPFVMYIAEFTSTLDKQDLADIWQGVMPKIAMTAEREEQEIAHKNTPFDFFHGQGLPKDVKFMIFKAKKRAAINYYKMTADSTDDGLFPSIQAGKPPSPYSFNWPYDYCSLIETARVDVEIDYINRSGSSDI